MIQENIYDIREFLDNKIPCYMQKYKEAIKDLQGLCLIRVMSNFDFLDPGQ